MTEIHPVNGDEHREVGAMVRLIASRLLSTGRAVGAEQDLANAALMERVFAYVADAERRIADRDRRIAYLQDLSMTDELTGLLNRRGFTDQFRRALASAKRYGHEGLLVYCDLDNFKSINDRYGHAAGDALLKHVAGILERSVRASDLVARLGGDEFAVALVQTGRRDGMKRARTIQWTVENEPFVVGGVEIPVQMSIGDEPFGGDGAVDDVIDRADMAMYYAKRGRSGGLSPLAAE